jgi:hypothetical protein
VEQDRHTSICSTDQADGVPRWLPHLQAPRGPSILFFPVGLGFELRVLHFVLVFGSTGILSQGLKLVFYP